LYVSNKFLFSSFKKAHAVLPLNKTSAVFRVFDKRGCLEGKSVLDVNSGLIEHVL
jgi:hypothetical protein